MRTMTNGTAEHDDKINKKPEKIHGRRLVLEHGTYRATWTGLLGILVVRKIASKYQGIAATYILSRKKNRM